MQRRDFLRYMVAGLGAAGLLRQLPWLATRPQAEASGQDPIRLALLADAHLKDGNPARPEARALARAVTEVRGVQPGPDLVLLAGDLAHAGDPHALALGREMLSDLPAPLVAVRGEGDGVGRHAAFWTALFDPPWFSYTLRGVQLLGLHTAWCSDFRGPFFCLGDQQRRWLMREIPRLDPAKPLLILSHAPLAAIYRPWQQWTADAETLAPLLRPFHQVLCLHGHGHYFGAGDLPNFTAWSPDSQGLLYSPPVNPHPPDNPPVLHLGLPAISWPGPWPLQGTPPRRAPGLAPSGCGWIKLLYQQDTWELQPRLWSA